MAAPEALDDLVTLVVQFWKHPARCGETPGEVRREIVKRIAESRGVPDSTVHANIRRHVLRWGPSKGIGHLDALLWEYRCRGKDGLCTEIIDACRTREERDLFERVFSQFPPILRLRR